MLKKSLITLLALSLLGFTIAGAWYWNDAQKYPKPAWTDEEKTHIISLWLDNLPPLPPDPSNAVADNPAAAALGHQIFFDKRFSGNGQVACVSCHQPDKHFTDGKAVAVGMGITRRSSPSIVGTAYHPFIFWDGRADSQWVQALGPMESAVEHGGSRMQYAHLIAGDDNFRQQYENLFGPLPDLSNNQRFPSLAGPVDKQANPAVAEAWIGMEEDDRNAVTRIYTNIGKSVAAYERLLTPSPSRFDTYAESLKQGAAFDYKLLTPDEAEGLRLFIGKARCIECHNGPLFSNDGFQNIGTPSVKGKPFDFGRSIGVQKVIHAEFNCLSQYSDAEPADCGELRFIKRVGDDLAGSFKVPGLRNVTQTAPYMHSGQFADLDAVMEHYNDVPIPPFGHSMLTKLKLEPHQLQQLKTFMHTLDSGIAADKKWLAPPVTQGDNVATLKSALTKPTGEKSAEQ
ncbi:MAG: cytochrome c peroxidase [Gammaproteobacteria bacterium]